jgi:DNA-binding NtrC family response regulator
MMSTGAPMPPLPPHKVAVFERDWERRSHHRVMLEAVGCQTAGFDTLESLVTACRTAKHGFDLLLLASPGDVISVAASLEAIEVERLRTLPLLLILEERQVHAVHGIARSAPSDFILYPFGADELRSRVRRLGLATTRPIALTTQETGQ